MLGFKNKEWAVLSTSEKIDYDMRYSFGLRFDFYFIFVLMFIHILTIFSIGILGMNETITEDKIQIMFEASMSFMEIMWILLIINLVFSAVVFIYQINRFNKWKKTLRLDRRDMGETPGIINEIIKKLGGKE